MRLFVLFACVLNADPLPRDTGYRGIWYMNQPTNDEYVYKYSGGFATYPQQHVPIAIYSKEANKTFFVYGGTVAGRQELLHMVSYFDHKTKTVPRPVILLNKKTDDAHDNPVLSIDAQGHLWIFSNAHGTSRPSYIHRATKPYSIDAFERVYEGNYSYGNPWFLHKTGFLFLHTRYNRNNERALFWMTSPDGRKWSEPSELAFIEKGNYLLSWSDGRRVGAVMDYHPQPVGLNARTNVYYVETPDGGKTWTNVKGEILQLPLRERNNPALVHDYKAEDLLVYKKDLQFDRSGRPVILYLTSKSWNPGPKGGPHKWYTAHWTGTEWRIRHFTDSDHNYDYGSLYIEPDGSWRIIAPTDPGPEPFGTGGEIVMWTSRDEGANWTRVKNLTKDSPLMHTYVRRPVNAHPEFYAIWADGSTRRPSESRLYFTDRTGSRVCQLPPQMDEIAHPCPTSGQPAR